MRFMHMVLMLAVVALPMGGYGQTHDNKAGPPTHKDPRQVVPAYALTPPAALKEGGGMDYARLVRNGPDSTTVQLEIRSEPAGSIMHRSSLILAAGVESVRIPVYAVDNALTDLGRRVRMVVSANDTMVAVANVEIIDDEPPPVMSLVVPPRLEEGRPPLEGRITTNRPASADFRIKLATDFTGQITLPGAITMKAGQQSATFRIGAVDDPLIDGNRPVSVMATAGDRIRGVSSSTLAVDNEWRVLTVRLPGRLDEGGRGMGRLSVGRALPSKLDVTMLAGDSSSLRIPSKVVIPAGRSSVEFPVSAVLNTNSEGDRRVHVTASAPGFLKGSSSLLIRDLSLASIAISTVPEFIKAGGTLTTQIHAYTKSRLPLTWFRGEINIEMIMADGKVLPLSHDFISTAFWSFKIKMPANVSGMVKLRARHTSGISAVTQAFEIIAANAPEPYAELALPNNDIIWDAVRNRLYASIPSSGGTHANHVVAIDPVTGKITGSVFIGQEPGQLALTSDAGALYVVRNANGSISKVNLEEMKVDLTFAVGTDPISGTLFAEDICTVVGQPDLLVVSRYVKYLSPGHQDVAVYDKGVARPQTTGWLSRSNRIEASADPTIFVGYNNESTGFEISHLRLDDDGITTEREVDGLIGGFYVDIQADANLLVSTHGAVVDGNTLRHLGNVASAGAVRPELGKGRIYVSEYLDQLPSEGYKIVAYDLTSFSKVREFKLPLSFAGVSKLIRWGETGLAFRNSSKIGLANGSRLVPSGAPANLEASIETAAETVWLDQPFNYTVRVHNKGSNPAYDTHVVVNLSAEQKMGAVSASTGTVTKPTNFSVRLPAGDIDPGRQVVLTISATPLSAGPLSCKAAAYTFVADPDLANNSAAISVAACFKSVPHTVKPLRLKASGLVNDWGRGLLWASVPSGLDSPVGKAVVSIDPLSGLVSPPIPLGAEPYENSMAISGNGRYLYVGLSDVPEVARIDLDSPDKSVSRIPLGFGQPGGVPVCAQDIEVLDGDGTSFLVTTNINNQAAVFDGAVRRSISTPIHSVSLVEPSGTPGVFIGWGGSSLSPLTRLQVNADGVSSVLTVQHVVPTYHRLEIEADAGWVLASTGQLVNAATFALEANLGTSGRPCLDVANQRAYLVNGSQLRVFDINNGESVGFLSLPTWESGDWAKQCLRWGSDGFAVLGPDTILIARWSQPVQSVPVMAAAAAAVAPTGIEDSDGDGIADGLEWLLGTPPDRHNANPLTIAGVSNTSPHVLHVAFPRRVGLIPGSYGFETSADLRNWTPAGGVVESTGGTTTVDGVMIEHIHAAIPIKPGPSQFVRLYWNP